MENGSAWRVCGSVFLAVFGMAIGGLCFAQDDGQAGKEAVKPEQQAQQKEEQVQPGSGVVEQVMVTAEKRTEDVQQVPEALSVLNPENLGILFTSGPDIRTLSARVPSLMIESSFGRAFPRFYIRGLGNTDFDLNASQPVSMVVDEVVRAAQSDYESLITVTVATERQERSVSGTVYHDGKPRLVDVKGIRVDAEFGKSMIYVTNEDKPGFIGKFAGLLGDAKINIATFHLGRTAPGGDAIALVEIDGAVPADLLAKVQALPQVKQAKALAF